MDDYYNLVLIPIVVGMVEIVKCFNLNKKYIPVFSILFGILMVFISNSDVEWNKNLIDGLIIGLSSVRLYSGVNSLLIRF